MVMQVKIYADGADLASMAALASNHMVAGFTTNPTLCRKAGVTDYREFAQKVLAVIGKKPVSFEVFSDDMADMERQAIEIASWGENVYVKIPITNTAGESTEGVINRLAGVVKINVTAVMTREQIKTAVTALDGADGIVSVFAGRIADTGKDPVKWIRYALEKAHGKTKVLWASTREVYNVVQADECGCDIITMSPDLIDKISGFERDLSDYSLETVRQFKRDAEGYVL